MGGRRLIWNNGIVEVAQEDGKEETERQAEQHDRLHVIATHRASIHKMATTALEALGSHENAAKMRHTVKHCQMRLCVLMDDANAAARALIVADAADE